MTTTAGMEVYFYDPKKCERYAGTNCLVKDCSENQDRSKSAGWLNSPMVSLKWFFVCLCL